MRFPAPLAGGAEETPGVGDALALIGIIGRKLDYKPFSVVLLESAVFRGAFVSPRGCGRARQPKATRQIALCRIRTGRVDGRPLSLAFQAFRGARHRANRVGRYRA